MRGVMDNWRRSLVFVPLVVAGCSPLTPTAPDVSRRPVDAMRMTDAGPAAACATSPWYALGHPADNSSSNEASESGDVTYFWDDQALYLITRFEDRDLVALDGRDDEWLFRLGDLAEWFIGPAAGDAMSQGSRWYLELHAAPDGKKRAYLLTRRGLPQPIDSSIFEVGVELDGSLNHWADEDAGWVVHWRLPWRVLQQYDPAIGPGSPLATLVGRYNYGRQLAAASPEITSAPKQTYLSFHLREQHARLRLLSSTTRNESSTTCAR